MNSPTPEEIKRHAIGFKDYFCDYNKLVRIWNEANKSVATEDIDLCKSDDTLYSEFTEHKPVSLYKYKQ